jgi:hypothetical protein
MKGASGRFAQYARQHCRVVVLTNPPPNIYSSRENNTYQQLEEPILKGLFGGTPVRRIDYLHPTVDGAAHVTYQAWPCDKTQEWAIPFGKRYVKSWKRLNWSYTSLVNTSQLGLKPQHNQVLPVASTMRLAQAQSSGQRDHMAVHYVSGSNNLPKLAIDDTNVVHAVAGGEDAARPQQDVDHIEEGRPAAGFGNRYHESRVLGPGPRPGGLANSNSDLIDRQIYDQVEQRSDFHDQGISKESKDSPTPVYTLKRCSTPKAPVKAPVIRIDDIVVGTEVTVDIGEHRADKVFLYLTLACVSGLRIWWKLRWIDRIGKSSE